MTATASPRVLILEDRPVDRLLLRTLLAYRHFSIFEAANGQEGLAIAASEPLDLVISDVLMPAMDGFEFVRRLRRTAAGADLPVLFYTATYHERDARALAAECGVVDILLKPSEPAVLLAKVEEMLARERARAAPIVDERFAQRHARLASERLIDKIRDLEQTKQHAADLSIQLRERNVAIDEARTAAGTFEAQLRQAQKMEAVGQLAGGVAHDFNNLLTVILGYSRFLLESSLDERQRDDVQRIIAAGERAGSLTRQLLAFSRKNTREVERFDLNVLIAELVDMLKRLIGENIELVTRLSDTPPIIEADRIQIEQILVNLVVNARDAMSSGGTVTISTELVTAEGQDWAELIVADTGTGMTEEVRQRIFEPFFTTKPAGKGTGLGLATVFGIASESGGHVSVDTEIGRGSAFRIFLPRFATPDAPRPAPEGSTSGGPESLLVVEDDAAVRDLIQIALKRKGYRVVATSSPTAALAVNSHFDLVITDVLMPGGTGPEVVAHLRTRLPALKALFVSGYASEMMLDTSQLREDEAFLAKPFTPDGIARKVREVLDR